MFENEIEYVAKLMKITVKDHGEYMDKVHLMIDYFAILDEVGGTGEASAAEVPLEELRADAHIPFGGDVASCLKTDPDGLVRVPKMA